jgi:vacuolar-type H+-ATPase catalytic subunit A/Vma1
MNKKLDRHLDNIDRHVNMHRDNINRHIDVHHDNINRHIDVHHDNINRHLDRIDQHLGEMTTMIKEMKANRAYCQVIGRKRAKYFETSTCQMAATGMNQQTAIGGLSKL